MSDQKNPITFAESQQRAAVTVKEFAKLVGVSERSIYRDIHRGKIPYKICGGNRRLIPRSFLLEIAGEEAAE